MLQLRLERSRRAAAHFDRYAATRARWKARNRYYHATLERLARRTIPPGARVLELGCGTGDLLAGVQPSFGVGIDLSEGMVREARRRYGGQAETEGRLHFLRADAQSIPFHCTFDYVICSDLLGHLDDIQLMLAGLHRVCTPQTKILITYWNFAWQLPLMAAERLGLKMPEDQQNWLGMADVDNLLRLTDFATLDRGTTLLVPKPVPVLAPLLNELGIRLPFLRTMGLITYWVARPLPAPLAEPLTCSVIVPCRNEEDNIAACVERLPPLGAHTELIFVDGASTDRTRERILEQIRRYAGRRDIKLLDQVPDPQAPPPPELAPFAATTAVPPPGLAPFATTAAAPQAARGMAPQDGGASGRPAAPAAARQPAAGQTAAEAGKPAPPVKMLRLGKGDAVRKGFAAASGDVLFILDADLTVPPEDLPKFLAPIATGKADFVNGTRLVYPLEDEAMRPINLIGNKFFSVLFTWLLDQRIKDTLCGTKVLRKRDYERIAANRSYFGDFDPFGDFDLLFGAARLGLRIVEVPVRYRRRTAGYSKVQVYKHGLLLLRMSLIAFRRLKLARWVERLRSLRRGQ